MMKRRLAGALARRFAEGVLAAAVVFALAADVPAARASHAPRQAESGDAVTITFVVVGLQSDPSRALQLSFTGGFTAINRLAAEVAPGDPGIGRFTWQGDELRMGAQSGETEVKLKVEFELSRAGTLILGQAQVPSGTIVDAVLAAGQPLLISGLFTLPTSAQLGATASEMLAISPGVVHPGGMVALAGGVGGRCTEGTPVLLLSDAFAHRHRFDGVPAVETIVGPGGERAALITVPRAAASGGYAITARCGDRNLGTVAHLHVRA
jgi:hypothetical protein